MIRFFCKSEALDSNISVLIHIFCRNNNRWRKSGVGLKKQQPDRKIFGSGCVEIHSELP